MKKLLVATLVSLGLLGAAFAQTLSGMILTSPIIAPGAFPIWGPTQSTGARVTGGTFTANSGSAVTVANTAVTANSVILFGLKTAGGTPAAPFMVTVTPGTGFTVNSGGSDTSTYNYLIIG